MAESLLHDIKRTLWLAAPVIVGQVASVSMAFIDTVMSGQLGPVALASVAMGSAVWSALLMFTIGMMMAVSASVSQLHGAERHQHIGRVVRQSAYLALVLGFLFLLMVRHASPVLELMNIKEELRPITLDYLDGISWGFPALAGYFMLRFMSEGMSITRVTMYFGGLGLVLNVPANYVFMYGVAGFPELGAAGIGYASSVVQWLMFIGIAIYMKMHPDYGLAELYKKPEAPDWKQISRLFILGFPIAVSIFVEGSLFVTVALLMGSLGTIAAAAHQIAINFAALLFMVPLGLGMALTVRVGNAVGRGDGPGARRAGTIGYGMVIFTQLISASIMLLFPEAIATIYTDDQVVIQKVTELLFLAAIFQFPDGIQVAAAGALRGLKDTRIPMLYTIFAFWMIGLPVAYGFGFMLDIGAPGLWYGMIGGLSVAALLLYVRFMLLTGQKRIGGILEEASKENGD